MESHLSNLYSEIEAKKYWSTTEQIKHESQKYYFQHLSQNKPVNEETKLTISSENEASPKVEETKTRYLKQEQSSTPIKSWDKWGKFGIKLFGVGVYMYDVVSDLFNGSSYISGEAVNVDSFHNHNNTEYRNDVCENLVKYSHPIWGILTVALAWLPSLCLFFVLWSALHSKPTLKRKHLLLGCLHIFVYLLWPFCGIML